MLDAVYRIHRNVLCTTYNVRQIASRAGQIRQDACLTGEQCAWKTSSIAESPAASASAEGYGRFVSGFERTPLREGGNYAITSEERCLACNSS